MFATIQWDLRKILELIVAPITAPTAIPTGPPIKLPTKPPTPQTKLLKNELLTVRFKFDCPDIFLVTFFCGRLTYQCHRKIL